MKRMKTFLIYALLIAALWIFSDMVIYLVVNGTYKPINTRIYVNSPQIVIEESKATYVNGYVKGSIKNNTEDIIKNMYLKIDMYSVRDNNLGTKYVKIEDLKVDENQNFEMWYQFTDVNYTTIAITDNVQDAEEDEFLSQKLGFYFLAGKLMFLYFMV